MRSLAALAILCLACAGAPGCAGAGANGDRSTAGPIVVTTLSEANAALGKVVRIQGTAQREKLGDAVHAPGIAVVCLDQRFPDDVLGKPVGVEGTLELTDEFQAVVGPGGEISQGTEAGTSTYVIRGCALR